MHMITVGVSQSTTQFLDTCFKRWALFARGFKQERPHWSVSSFGPYNANATRTAIPGSSERCSLALIHRTVHITLDTLTLPVLLMYKVQCPDLTWPPCPFRHLRRACTPLSERVG
eukprot:2842810-Pleurochrysis_carterae.AAC.2